MGTGEYLKGQRGDESTGARRHHDADIGPFTAKQPQDPYGFIGRNTPGDTEHDAKTGERGAASLHGGRLLFALWRGRFDAIVNVDAQFFLNFFGIFSGHHG